MGHTVELCSDHAINSTLPVESPCLWWAVESPRIWPLRSKIGHCLRRQLRKIFMSTVGIGLAALTLAVLSGCAAAPPLWPNSLATEASSASASSTKAPRRDNVQVVDADPGVPASQARWSGYWTGWWGSGKTTEHNLVVFRVLKDQVQVDWSYGFGDNKTAFAVTQARFEGDELVVSFPNGAYTRYRMRPNGNEIELIMKASTGAISYGVMARANAWGRS